jgi:hypothetical protein
MNVLLLEMWSCISDLLYAGIQQMGVACLKLPVQRVRDYAKVWEKRAAALAPVLQAHGWQLPTPRACEK